MQLQNVKNKFFFKKNINCAEKSLNIFILLFPVSFPSHDSYCVQNDLQVVFTLSDFSFHSLWLVTVVILQRQYAVLLFVAYDERKTTCFVA